MNVVHNLDEFRRHAHERRRGGNTYYERRNSCETFLKNVSN